MALSLTMNPAKMSRARRERFAYWRAVPLSRLRFLLFAVFFTFGTLGFLVSLLSAGKMPLLIGFGWAAYSGSLVVCYVLVTARKPAFFPMMVGIH
jgi:hypothetical protein